MSEMKQREYYCPACNWKYKTTTNHDGEIYSGCKECSNSVLYPVNDSREFTPVFSIFCYNYDLDKSNNNEEYAKLKDYLSNDLGYKKNSIQVPFYSAPTQHYKHSLFLHDGETIFVSNAGQFDDQYVTNLGRLSPWMEFNWDNKRIKTGFYLLPL